MTQKKRLLKIGAGVLGALLVVGIIAGADYFFGGPISEQLAGEKMQGYLNRVYPYRQLRIREVSCDTAFQEYYAAAFAPADENVRFTVYYKNGSFYDTYEKDIKTGRFLLSKQEKICTDSVSPLFETMPEIDSWKVWGLDPQGEGFNLDPPYRWEMTPTFEIRLHSTVENPTPEEAARLLQKVCELMKKSGYTFELYRIILDSKDGGDGGIDAYGFTPEMIRSPGFVDSFAHFYTLVEFPKGSGDFFPVYTPEGAREGAEQR